MAMSRPVVAARIPTLEEVVEDGRSGILVEPNSGFALAQGVLDVVSEPERAQAMGRWGRQIVERRFDIRQTAKCLEDIYLSVLER